MVYQKSLILFSFVVLLFQIVIGDVFNSQEELDSLFHIQLQLQKLIRNYVKAEELRIEELKLTQKRFENIGNSNSNNGKFLQNPVNAFIVVKTLAKDLDFLLDTAEEQMKNFNQLLSVVNDIRNVDVFPDEKDVKGAALAINRLQEIYKFDASQMGEGFLGTYCCSIKLQASDFFELGKQSFISEDYLHTMDWMNQALILLNKDDSYEIGANAMKLEANEIIKEVRQIQSITKIDENFNLTSIDDVSNYTWLNVNIKENETWQDYILVKKKYEALCREEVIKISANSKLKCSFSSRNSKYFILGPIKEEILNLSPLILLFHDVLYENEIKVLKELAQYNFETATVTNYFTGIIEASKDRSTKIAWLEKEDEPLIEKIDKRIAIISQLDLKFAEELQVANYGIGGHYEPHYDFSHGGLLLGNINQEEGNRIATFMFYMSDVEAGGGTVFPYLNLAVLPSKGSAIFWHNLLDNGDVDLRTRHAACPVLLGSKWVSNKWIHERGQEFLRPCIKPPIK